MLIVRPDGIRSRSDGVLVQILSVNPPEGCKTTDEGSLELRAVATAGRAASRLGDDVVAVREMFNCGGGNGLCLLYTSPSPRDGLLSRMPSSA